MSEKKQERAAKEIWDVERLRQRLGADESLVRLLLETFIEQWPKIMSPLQEFATEGNGDKLSRAAHTLKGAAANLEAANIKSICAEIERLAVGGDLAGASELIASLPKEWEKFLQAAASLLDKR